ncbi:recombinase family protein [Amycolatopsis sp. NPDC004378]
MTGTRPGTAQSPPVLAAHSGQERSQAEQHRLLLRPYLRVSQDQSGRERSPAEQNSDLNRDTETQNFDLHPDPYRDIGSASIYARKARDDFEQMIADLISGEFGADGLALWESSRGSRKVSEWAHLIELLADRKMKVWVHTHGRVYDMTRARDRRTLQEDAVDSEYESAKTSDRSKRSHNERAEEGGPAGRLSVGQIAEYDPRTGRLIRRSWDPEVSKLPLELFDRIRAGDALSRIARDWKERGILNGVGKPYTSSQLLSIARNRAYIAQRVHIVGQPGKSWWQVPPETVSITPGKWEPLLKTKDDEPDFKLFDDVQALLATDDRRNTYRPARARHRLSSVALCDPCGGPLRTKTLRGEPVYTCAAKTCVTVPEHDLDKFVTEMMLAYLADPEQYGQLDHGRSTPQELRAARAERDRWQTHYDDMKAQLRALRMSAAAFAETEPSVVASLEEWKVKVQRLERPSRLAGLIEPGPDVADRWPEDIVVERKIAAALLQRDALGELRIVHTPRRGPVRAPIEDRVRFVTDEG